MNGKRSSATFCVCAKKWGQWATGVDVIAWVATLTLIVAVFVFPYFASLPGYYYAYEIRGPFHAQFLWVHKALFVEILGGGIVGFFVGRWIYSRREPSYRQTTWRQDLFPIAMIAMVMLAIHPDRQLTRIMDRITGVNLLSGSFELAAPSDRGSDLGAKSIGSKGVAQTDIVPGASSVDFLVIGSDAILNTYRLMRNGPINRDFLENNPWSEGSSAQFRRFLLKKSINKVAKLEVFLSNNSGALFVYKFAMPIAECSAVASVTDRSITTHEELKSLYSSVILINDVDTIIRYSPIPDSIDGYIGLFVDNYKSLLKSATLRAARYAADEYIGALVVQKCARLAHFLFNPGDLVPTSVLPGPERQKIIDRLYDTYASPRLEIDDLVDEFVASQHDQIRDGLLALAREQDRPWFALLASGVSTMSSSPFASVTLLDAWLRSKSNEKPDAVLLHDRVAVLERIVKTLLSTQGSNPIKLAAYSKELIKVYQRILSPSGKSIWKLKFYVNKKYCVGNLVARRYLYRYLEAMNVYVSVVSENQILHDPSADIGVGSFEHIDRAKSYAEILLGSKLFNGDKGLSEVDIDCLVEGIVGEPVLTKMAWMDSAVALTLAELDHVELSPPTVREYWLKRTKTLRDRIEPVYAEFKRHRERKAREAALGAGPPIGAFADVDSSRFLVLVQRRLSDLAVQIRRLD